MEVALGSLFIAAVEVVGVDPVTQRIFIRDPWENAAIVLIAAGVFMLMQPFLLAAYTYSFVVTLVGTVMFIIVSHFPE